MLYYKLKEKCTADNGRDGLIVWRFIRQMIFRCICTELMTSKQTAWKIKNKMQTHFLINELFLSHLWWILANIWIFSDNVFKISPTSAMLWNICFNYLDAKQTIIHSNVRFLSALSYVRYLHAHSVKDDLDSNESVSLLDFVERKRDIWFSQFQIHFFFQIKVSQVTLKKP